MLEQPSIVVQSVPSDAPLLYFPLTLHRPGRRPVLNRTRRAAAAAAAAAVPLAPGAQTGGLTAGVAAALRPEL